MPGTKNLTKSRFFAGLCLTGDKKAKSLYFAKNVAVEYRQKFVQLTGQIAAASRRGGHKARIPFVSASRVRAHLLDIRDT